MSDERSDLGTVLVVHLGHCQKNQLDAALRMMADCPGMKLGEALISIDAITRDQLAEALRVQRRLRNPETATETMAQICHRHFRALANRYPRAFA